MTNQPDEMTLRDWFAGQALTGMIAHGPERWGGSGEKMGAMLSWNAYQMADRMLTERAKGTKP
jgi:hypothetical protein